MRCFGFIGESWFEKGSVLQMNAYDESASGFTTTSTPHNAGNATDSRQAILMELQREFESLFPQREGRFSSDASLRGTLELSSLDTFRYFSVVEDEFGVNFSNRSALGIQTVEDLVRFIEESKGGE